MRVRKTKELLDRQEMTYGTETNKGRVSMELIFKSTLSPEGHLRETVDKEPQSVSEQEAGVDTLGS
jgi:hypothetical protein